MGVRVKIADLSRTFGTAPGVDLAEKVVGRFAVLRERRRTRIPAKVVVFFTNPRVRILFDPDGKAAEVGAPSTPDHWHISQG